LTLRVSSWLPEPSQVGLLEGPLVRHVRLAKRPRIWRKVSAQADGQGAGGPFLAAGHRFRWMIGARRFGGVVVEPPSAPAAVVVGGLGVESPKFPFDGRHSNGQEVMSPRRERGYSSPFDGGGVDLDRIGPGKSGRSGAAWISLDMVHGPPTFDQSGLVPSARLAESPATRSDRG